MSLGRTALITVGLLAASVWVGSLVCLAIVGRVATRVLDGPARVALFRGIGRLYGIVGTACLVVAIVVGLIIAWPLSDASGTTAVVLVLTVALVVVSGAGMAQARRMTIRRRRSLAAPQDPDAAAAVHHGAAVAAFLRGSIGVVTLVIVVLCAHLLTS